MEAAYYYLFSLFLIIAGVLEAAFLPHLRLAGHQLDLMLVLVAAWSMLRGPRQGLLWALIGGIILDLLSAAPFGVFTAALVAASLVSSVGSAALFRSFALLPVISSALATLTYYIVLVGLLYLAGRPTHLADALTLVLGPALLTNAVGMLFLFPFLRWIHRRTSPREVVW